MTPARANGGFVTDEVERSKSVPPIETIVDSQEVASMVRGSSPPAPTFVQKIGPNTILTLAGAVIGAAVGWGVASQTISHMSEEIRSLKTDVKVLQRAEADSGAERAAIRQWMIDHGVKLATPAIPPPSNQGDQ